MTVTKERKAKKTGNPNSDENVLAMYLKEISRIPILSREEEEEAARAASQGNLAARNKLVNGNLRFVVNVAKKYQGKGLPLADLIGEGNTGLVMAVDRYDVNRGYHFISYAVWWIRQTILKALNEKTKIIRLPQNRVNELYQIEKARQVLQEHGNTKDEIREIAEFLKMDNETVEDLINISKEIISLENPVYTDSGASVLGDFIEDEQYSTPDQNVVRSILKDDIENVLKTLNQKEADVIRLRFGLGSRPAMSLKEIGDRYNLSKERIRQIEKDALLRLKRPSCMLKLVSYVA